MYSFDWRSGVVLALGMAAVVLMSLAAGYLCAWSFDAYGPLQTLVGFGVMATVAAFIIGGFVER